MRRWEICLAVCLLCVFSSVHAATIVLEDDFESYDLAPSGPDTFATSPWSVADTSWYSVNTASGYFNVVAGIDDLNSTGHLTVEHFVKGASNLAKYTRPDWIVDPSTVGGITAICYKADYFRLPAIYNGSGTYGTMPNFGGYLEQDGKGYYVFQVGQGTNEPPYGVWTTRGDAAPKTPTPNNYYWPVDGGSGIDFSATGSPIAFGFFSHNSTGNDGTNDRHYRTWLDNVTWTIEANQAAASPVPEPITLTGLGLAAAGLAGYLRRRRA